MRIHTKWLLIAMLIFFSFGCVAKNAQIAIPHQIVDGKIARDHLQRTVQNLFYSGDFYQLEKMAMHYRNTKERFPEGAWKLSFFYGSFRKPRENTPDDWKRFLQKFDKWLGEYPNSITARIAASCAWMNYGWNARGDDFANTVSEQGWKDLAERLQIAHSLIEKEPTSASQDDPERYLLLLLLANAQGWDDEKYETVFLKAIALEPTYYEYYLNKAGHLMPRWQGLPGDWQRFAEKASTLTPKSEGLTIYTRIVWSMWLVEEFTSFDDPGVSWEKMRQGFIDIERNFPNSPWNLNFFCKFACLAGDKKTAIALFKRIGDRPYVEAWNGRGEYEQCREWAGIVKPRDEATLTNIYLRGDTEDYYQMLELAREGDPIAQFNIGKTIREIHHFAHDDKEVAKWYRKAAEQGLADAQAALGTLYTGSTGVNQDYIESIKWIRSAAEQGNRSGIFFLAFAYYGGDRGVRKDLIQAYAWFSQINKKDMLDKLRASFLPEQLEAAEKEAQRIKAELAAKNN